MNFGRPDIVRFTIAAIALVTLTACGGSDTSPLINADPPAAVVITITSGPPPGGTVGSRYNWYSCPYNHCSYRFQLTASGGAAGRITWGWAAALGSSLPPGLSITGNLIDGTPPIGSTGNYNVIVTASYQGTPAAKASAAYTISIVNPPPPVIATQPGPPGATLNQPYGYQFEVTGLEPVFSETGALPPGLAALTTNGLLAGTPTSTGLYPITVHATDAVGQEKNQAFTIGVYQHGFSSTGSMQDIRMLHTATLLADGQVLVAGGVPNIDGITRLSSSELYSPASGNFAPTGAMQIARSQHTATLLCDPAASPCSNPKVLIVGGEAAPGAIGSAELYDPAAATFTLTVGALATARYGHTATRLQSGKVLIAGGNRTGTIDTNTLASAELFNPATGTFSATATPMSSARFLHTATLLPNGTVLIVGGVDQNHATVLASAELFDPATETFSTVPSPMTAAREGHTATLLPSGKVLIAGGLDPSGKDSAIAEIYDPVTVAPASSFTTTGALVTPRWRHTAVLMPGGQVLVAGGSTDQGQNLPHAELYDPASGQFESTGGMQAARVDHALVSLGNSGSVLVVGGDAGNTLNTAERYQ